jgi:hypothetical protein
MIVKNATVVLKTGATVVEDISCYVTAVELSTSAELIDTGTFCDPASKDSGIVTREGTLMALWSGDMYTSLKPLEGTAYDLVLTVPDGTITCEVVIPHVPFGRYEIGQRVEVDIPLILNEEPTFA